jgi:hypothetical protein
MATNFLSELTRFNPQGCERRRVKRLAPLAGAAVLAGLLAAGSEARAALILAGDSNSSTLSNCVGIPASTCGSGGTVTSLGLDSFTLDITTPFPFSVSANTTAVPLAQLELITENNPSGTANFHYNLVLNFTTPSGNFSDTIPLSMSATGTGTNSSETLSGFPSTLTGLPSLPGATVSNFAFVTAGGNAGGNTFSGGNWTVTRGPGMPGSTAGLLDLVADVAAAAPPGVPEPSSLAVLGAALSALVGLGLVRRRLKGYAALNFSR